MNFEKAEKYREKHPFLGEQKAGSDFGWFIIPFESYKLRVMVAPSTSEWQHVSVSLKNRCPNWKEMCFIKDLFFEDHETVVQFHPAKKDYVNIAENCLHLWRCTTKEFPMPPKICV